jgi:hypothetical protein
MSNGCKVKWLCLACASLAGITGILALDVSEVRELTVVSFPISFHCCI